MLGTGSDGGAAPAARLWRIEVRFDFTGTEAEARRAASKAAAAIEENVAGAAGSEPTAIFDEDFNEI